MLSIYDNDTLAEALARPIDPDLARLIEGRWALAETTGLARLTHLLVVQPGDDEADIENEIGFRPTESPIDGAHYGTLEFCAYWSWLRDLGGWYEMIVTIGNDGFAYVMLMGKAEGVPRALLDMCAEYGGGGAA